MFSSVLRVITAFLGLNAVDYQYLHKPSSGNATSVHAIIASLRAEIAPAPTARAVLIGRTPHHPRAPPAAPGISPNPLAVFKRACDSKGNNYCFSDNKNYCTVCDSVCCQNTAGQRWCCYSDTGYCCLKWYNGCCKDGATCLATTCAWPTVYSTTYYYATTTYYVYVTGQTSYYSTVYVTTTVTSTSTDVRTTTVPYGAKARLAKRTASLSSKAKPTQAEPAKAHRASPSSSPSPSPSLNTDTRYSSNEDQIPGAACDEPGKGSLLDPAHYSPNLELLKLRLQKIGLIKKRAVTYTVTSMISSTYLYSKTSTSSYIYTSTLYTTYRYTVTAYTTVIVNKVVTADPPPTTSTTSKPPTTTTTTTTPPTTISGKTSTTTISATSANKDQSNGTTTINTGGGLSSGAKIGIGAGGGISAAIILAIIGYFLGKWCLKHNHHNRGALATGAAVGAIGGGAASGSAMAEPRNPPGPGPYSGPMPPPHTHQPIYNPVHQGPPPPVSPQSYEIFHDPTAGQGHHQPWTNVSATVPELASGAGAGAAAGGAAGGGGGQTYIPYSVPHPSGPPPELYGTPPPPFTPYGTPPPGGAGGGGSPVNGYGSSPSSPIQRKLLPLAALAALPLAALPKVLAPKPRPKKIRKRKNQIGPYHHHHIHSSNPCLEPNVVASCELLRLGHVCKIPEAEPIGPCVCRDEDCLLNKEEHECFVSPNEDLDGYDAGGMDGIEVAGLDGMNGVSGGRGEKEGCGCGDLECSVTKEVLERKRQRIIMGGLKTGMRESVRMVVSN